MTEYEQIVRVEKARAYARGRAAVESGLSSEKAFLKWWLRRPEDEWFYLMGRARMAFSDLCDDGA